VRQQGKQAKKNPQVAGHASTCKTADADVAALHSGHHHLQQQQGRGAPINQGLEKIDNK
jgi:hypothetical protein